MQNESPLISVVLPVYNAEKYIKESVQSVLNQTFKNFELIIINDGSKDNSSEVIRSIKDYRIVFVEQANIGLPATLNRGISMARADIIARQDNDDVCLPERFQKQYDYLNKNPKVALLGTAAEIINENGESLHKYHDHQTEKNLLKFALLFNNPFVHSSVMFRKSIVEKSGNYYTGTDVFEDYNLWSRIAHLAEIANLPERLIKYREVNSSMSRTTDDYRQRVTNQALKNIKYYCEKSDEKEIVKFANCLLGVGDYNDFDEAVSLIEKIMNELSTNFSKKENIPHSDFEEEAKKQILNFKRSHYNEIIFRESAGGLEKIRARVLRKILFMRHKKYLI